MRKGITSFSEFNKANVIKKCLLLIFCFMFLFTFMACNNKDKSTEPGGKIAEGNFKKVIILTGQSNATGISYNEYAQKNCSQEAYNKYLNGFDTVKIKYKSDENKSLDFVNVKLGQGKNEYTFGPEIGLAETLSNAYPEETFYIIKCTYSGTCLHNEWLDNGKRSTCYNGLAEYVTSTMESLGSEYKIVACCFMQGESDGVYAFDDHYYDNLSNVVSYMRLDFTDYICPSGMYFLDAGIAANWSNYKDINNSKIKFSKDSTLNAYIDTIAAGLSNSKEPEGNVDSAHYDATSEIKLGNLFGEYILKVM